MYWEAHLGEIFWHFGRRNCARFLGEEELWRLEEICGLEKKRNLLEEQVLTLVRKLCKYGLILFFIFIYSQFLFSFNPLRIYTCWVWILEATHWIVGYNVYDLWLFFYSSSLDSP